MIIECESCHRKFNLDERRLKPTGSRVRCSKCRTLFRAWPPGGDVAAPAAGSEPAGVPVSVPVTCTEVDEAGRPLNFHIGRVTELSQGRLMVDVFCSSPPERVALSFINTANQETQIRARVVHSSRGSSGKTRIGLALLGSSAETTDFVKQLVQSHHHTAPQTAHPAGS